MKAVLILFFSVISLKLILIDETIQKKIDSSVVKEDSEDDEGEEDEELTA